VVTYCRWHVRSHDDARSIASFHVELQKLHHLHRLILPLRSWRDDFSAFARNSSGTLQDRSREMNARIARRIRRIPPRAKGYPRVREGQEEPGEAKESLCSVKCTLTEAQERTRPLQCRFALYARLRLDKARARARRIRETRLRIRFVEINRHRSVSLILPFC